jgi:hypothetical protein
MDKLGDSDVLTQVNSIQFIAEQDFIDQHGESFVLSLNENQGFQVLQKNA